MGAAAVVVDFSVIVFVTIYESDVGAEFFKNGFINHASSTVSAVHADFEIVKVGLANIV